MTKRKYEDGQLVIYVSRKGYSVGRIRYISDYDNYWSYAIHLNILKNTINYGGITNINTNTIYVRDIYECDYLKICDNMDDIMVELL